MERTLILDQDYLTVTYNFGKVSRKIPIMRDIGNLSGVARVTIPNEHGLYTVNYVRNEKKGEVIIGQISIPVVGTKENESTYDTETYSPKVLSTYQNHFTPYFPKDTKPTWQFQVKHKEIQNFHTPKRSH
jgi:hypothetical protein